MEMNFVLVSLLDDAFVKTPILPPLQADLMSLPACQNSPKDYLSTIPPTLNGFLEVVFADRSPGNPIWISIHIFI